MPTTGTRSIIALLLAASLLLVPMATGAEDDQDLTITLGPDGEAHVSGNTSMVQASGHSPGDAYAWNLSLDTNYTVVELQVQGTFDIDRPRQAVPLVDGKHFVRLKTLDVTEVDEPARVFNLTGNATSFTYRLGLPGPGQANLTLNLDTAPPGIQVGEPTKITHRSFNLKTKTTERALATLYTQAPGQDPIPRPTPTPAFEQTFPVIGLDPETTYDIWIEAEDWSGNLVTSESFTLTTEPLPDRPEPIITSVSPANEATVPPTGVTISAEIQDPESPVTADGVRLFFDKTEVSDGVQYQDGRVTYTPQTPLEERVYSVSLEVTNKAGGEAIERWSFTVEDPQASTPGPGAAIAAMVLGLLATIRRRR